MTNFTLSPHESLQGSIRGHLHLTRDDTQAGQDYVIEAESDPESDSNSDLSEPRTPGLDLTTLSPSAARSLYNASRWPSTWST